MSLEDLIRVTPEEKVAMKKLRQRTEEELKMDVEIFKEWWKKQAHFPTQIPHDDRLMQLIIRNKYSVEKCKQKMDYFFCMPHLYPEFFEDRHPLSPRIQKAFKNDYYVPLPKLAPDFGRITIMRVASKCVEPDQVGTIIKMLMISELRMTLDFCCSEHIIIDAKNATLSNTLKINPLITKKFMTAIQKGYSDAVLSIHIVNMPSFGTSTYNFTKGILKEKFQARIKIHDDEKDLLNYFPKEVLPKDYGGEEKSVEELNELWSKLLEDNCNFYENMDKRRSKEELRIGEPICDEFLGLQGTFRQLTVD